MCVLLCLRYFILISADVLNTGVWDVFEDDINVNSNKYLLGLVSSLKETVLSAKAPSTTDKYSGGWTRWKAFALQFGFQVFPDDHTELALYIRHLSISSSSIAQQLIVRFTASDGYTTWQSNYPKEKMTNFGKGTRFSSPEQAMILVQSL